MLTPSIGEKCAGMHFGLFFNYLERGENHIELKVHILIAICSWGGGGGGGGSTFPWEDL